MILRKKRRRTDVLKAIKTFEKEARVDLSVLGTYDDLADKVEELMEEGYGIDSAIQMMTIELLGEKVEPNPVKSACRRLGITQKQLAKELSVSEDTVGKWARGVVDTPQWAIRMFELLEIEKKFETIKRIISDEL